METEMPDERSGDCELRGEAGKRESNPCSFTRGKSPCSLSSPPASLKLEGG